jgi:hypothetical protein
MIVHIGTEKRSGSGSGSGAGMSQVLVHAIRRVVMWWELEEAHAMGPILSETVALSILVTL